MRISDVGLIEYLALRVGCMYVSDLHYMPYEQLLRLSQVVENLAADSASLYEWNDAVCYLTGDIQPYKSQEEAKEVLLKWISDMCEALLKQK